MVESFIDLDIDPPWPNTNDMIREELYTYGWTSNALLTCITYNPNGNNNGGWWCGYGWKKFNNHIFNRWNSR